jgi:hypothetical protein
VVDDDVGLTETGLGAAVAAAPALLAAFDRFEA